MTLQASSLVFRLFLGAALPILITAGLVGCGGGGGGGGSSPTPTPTATATATPTVTPTGPPPTPPPPPGVVFDVRGRVFVNRIGMANIQVTATGDSGAVTATERTLTGANGYYSFFLGQGRYTVTAITASGSASRVVVVPPGGQTVDNVDFNL